MIAAEAKNHFQSIAHHEMFDMQSTLDRVLNARHADMVARMGGGVSGNLLAVLAEELHLAPNDGAPWMLGAKVLERGDHAVDSTFVLAQDLKFRRQR